MLHYFGSYFAEISLINDSVIIDRRLQGQKKKAEREREQERKKGISNGFHRIMVNHNNDL